MYYHIASHSDPCQHGNSEKTQKPQFLDAHIPTIFLGVTYLSELQCSETSKSTKCRVRECHNTYTSHPKIPAVLKYEYLGCS